MTLPGRLVLLGHPVSHSLSPRMQQAALRAASISLDYEATDVAADALEESLRVLVAVRGAGNVTIPHKEAVYAACAAGKSVAPAPPASACFAIASEAKIAPRSVSRTGTLMQSPFAALP